MIALSAKKAKPTVNPKFGGFFRWFWQREDVLVFSRYSPDKEAEEAEQRVHESHLVGDAGDNGLLTVWTHSLHWRGLEHLPLQHRHGGGTARGQDSRRVASHMDEGPRPGTHVSRCRMREVARWRNVGTTCGGKQTVGLWIFFFKLWTIFNSISMTERLLLYCS